MLGDSSSLFGSTGGDGGAASGAALAHEGGGGGAAAVGGGSSSIAIAAAAAAVIGEDDRGRIDEFGERGSAGNRWPRQETLALLKIRSDMDVIFRDSSLKGPLWEEVSRKMAELGYHRSAKKCKEKFENVYKYHKRTKDGRAGKSDGKTYRFFDQLEAFENNPAHQLPALPAPPRPPPPPQAALLVSVAMPAVTAAVIQGSSVPVPSTTTTTTTAAAAVPSSASGAQPLNPLNPTASLPPPPPPQQIPSQNLQFQQPLMPHLSSSVPGHILSSPSSTPSSSSSTSSDEQILGRGKRKRKWKDFFERLMKEVIDKQEELQKKFLEAIEKREHDRLAREEAWKVQEMARLNREHEILVQERSMAAAKDAALIAFLQKISEQQQIPLPLQFVQPQSNSNIARRSSSANPAPVPAPMIPRSQPQPQPQPQAPPQLEETAAMAVPKPSQTALPPPQQLALTANVDPLKRTNGENSPLPPSPSRWPKAEVQALIDLRTNMDQKYQESGPKGPLWEEISASMRRLGYNRSAKRCKEKWENINKYFKKVKESNKKRPEDSKTCPYFHQLDAIYREKSIRIDNPFNNPATYALKSAEGGPVAAGTPIMARPEQQWPLPEDPGSHNGPDDSDGDLDDDDDDQAYEFVANSNAAVVGTAAAGGGEGGVAAAAAASMDNS